VLRHAALGSGVRKSLIRPPSEEEAAAAAAAAAAVAAAAATLAQRQCQNLVG